MKESRRELPAQTAMPDHWARMTDSWRRGDTPTVEHTAVPSTRTARSRWRERLHLAPYHRNPAHVLLARPRLIALLILVLALVLRVAEVERSSYVPINDARSYLTLGGQIAQHGDYASTDGGAGGSRGPTAYFAPGYPYLLGALDKITGDAPTGRSAVHAARLAQAVIGAVIVALIGLIALELFGIDMALLAMALAAIYPVLIELSSVLVAETLMVAFELAAVWCALRVRRSEDPLRWITAAGVMIGLAALTHVNAILLLLPVGIAVLGTVPVLGRRRVPALLVLIVSTLLTLTPWLVRDGLVMHTFVPVTDEGGITLAGTYNSASARQSPAYRWLLYTAVPSDKAIAREAPRLSETALDTKLEHRALSYIAHHPSAVASVGAHNTLRLLELEGTRTWQTSAASIGLQLGIARIGVWCFWALCALALLGLLPIAGLRAPGWLWLAPVLMWLSVALVNAETPRFREAIEPFLILLAARGVARLARWTRVRRSARPA